MTLVSMDKAVALVSKLGIKAKSLVVAINANADTLAKIKEGLPDEAILKSGEDRQSALFSAGVNFCPG